MPCGTLAEVEPYLLGLMYPATKEDIVGQARKNDADHLILEVLDKLSEKTYTSHPEVFDELADKWQQGKETLVPRSNRAER